MRNILLFAFVVITSFLNAQHTISGTFSPAKDFTWVIAYQIKPGTQAYIADTAVEDGRFTLQIPANAPSGTYRLVYAVPQEEFYFDVIYNGKENVQLAFDARQGISFMSSEENKIFHSYFKEVTGVKQEFMDFYSSGNSDKEVYGKLTEKLEAVQTSYEQGTEGMIVHNFVKANRPYIPTEYETTESYWQHKKENFFEYLDVKNTVLQASGFLTEKLTSYVFTPVSAEKVSKAATERTLQENIKTVHGQLKETAPLYQMHVFHTLWNKATSNGFDDTADFIFTSYLKDLATATNNQKIITDIETNNRLRVGAKAPEITWKDGDATKRLSDLEDAECYVVIFWSSTCSHCLRELPPLHKKLANYKNVKVLAVGLEENESTWKTESAKLSHFEHALALGKWDSEYVKTYAIQRTPTYYVLDSDKRILATPQSDRSLVEFLNN
ncbi:thioredoxin-like domain-containing protein [Maribacter algicola]|uniref:Thioredoxin-like domain-containing protein n=1 Tax=Meishania litoralis TaxID=3434685 RepID=A0ACC7LGX6_9FLAO